MCGKSTVDTDEIAERRGFTLGGLIETAQAGFNDAYREAEANGFKDSLLRAESKDRVNPIFDAIDAAYGSVDLKKLGAGTGLALYGAYAVIKGLNDVIARLENYATASPEEFAAAADDFLRNHVEDDHLVAGIRI